MTRKAKVIPLQGLRFRVYWEQDTGLKLHLKLLHEKPDTGKVKSPSKRSAALCWLHQPLTSASVVSSHWALQSAHCKVHAAHRTYRTHCTQSRITARKADILLHILMWYVVRNFLQSRFYTYPVRPTSNWKTNPLISERVRVGHISATPHLACHSI